MARLFGRDYSRSELFRKVGSIAQLGGVEVVELDSGRAQGVRVARVRTGPLTFTVLLGNALDIYDISYEGIPLAWQSPTGVAAGPYFEDAALRFLRTFQGGLLVTGGLTTMGAPSVDEGEALGLHGRIHHLPAENTGHNGHWEGDDFVIEVAGQVREAAVFGPNLVLTRRITARLGEAKLLIQDAVENQGFEPTPHMMLYHVNLGFPLLDVGSRLIVDSTVIPRDAEAEKGAGHEREFGGPVHGFSEQVYWHDVRPDAAGYCRAALVNPALHGGEGLGVYLRYPKAVLPWLYEWKMTGEGTYVLGVEPANALGYGRATERKEGRLKMLAPGETVSYELEIGVLTGAEVTEEATR